MDKKNFLDDGFLSGFENIKDMLYLQLVNFEKNEEALEKILYDRFLDLAVVPVIALKENHKSSSLIVVQRVWLDVWKVSAGEIFWRSYENGKEDCQIMPIEFSAEERGFEMFVLNSKKNAYGASAMLHMDALKKFSEEIQNERVFILPSSVFEVILIPEDNVWYDDVNELKKIIQEENASLKNPDNFLSNNVYVYSRGKNKLQIV